MKIIVSKEILQNEGNVKEKIEVFLKEKKIPKNWSVNIVNGKYIFEYMETEDINLFGDVNEDYLEMIIKKDD